MTIDTLRAVRNARPFRPFEIRTGSGEAYPVSRSEVIAISRDSDTVVVLAGPGRIGIIDMASITEVITFPSARVIGADDEPDITA